MTATTIDRAGRPARRVRVRSLSIPFPPYELLGLMVVAGVLNLWALDLNGYANGYYAAADQGYSGPAARWPDPFAAGSRKPQTGRTDGPRPRLELVRAGLPGTAHARWRPQAHPGGAPSPDRDADRRGKPGRVGGAGPGAGDER